MKQAYQITDVGGKHSSKELADFLAREGQLLLPMVELVEQAECAIDDVIDVMGRATIEAVLQMSAEQAYGPKRQGKASDREVYWHGRQSGRVALGERQLRINKPRVRKKRPQAGESAEAPIPAYEAIRKDGRLADRMLSILLCGVSTRRYAEVLPQMAEQVGVSRSQVSRETIEAGERVLKELMQRRFDEVELLVIYIDGLQMGDYHVIAAVGVDVDGRKHVLGLREGASENAEVCTALLEELVERGIKPAGVEGGRLRLFVLDGSKALRKAVDQVYGSSNPVQRCRNHKRRNVLGHLPKDQHDQARATLSAAFKLEAADGMKKLQQYASWLEREWPSAAGSLREGLEELFTVNRLPLPGSVRRSLVTTNVIDATHSGVRQRTRRVTNWQSGSMALRWAAAAFVETEKNYRRIMGHQQLWILKAHLDESTDMEILDHQRKVG